MGGNGSPLFALTWRAMDMPSGPPACQLAASARPTGDTAFSGWPTASSRDGKGGYLGGRIRNGSTSTDTLDVAAQLTAWPTPTEADERSSARHGYMLTGHQGTTMLDAARLAAWPTPCTPSGGRSTSTHKMDATGRTADGRKHTASLEHAAKFSAWPTPLEDDANNGTRASGDYQSLTRTAQFAGWPTPTTLPSDCGSVKADAAAKEAERKGWMNSIAVAAHSVLGPTSSGFPAGTGNGGQLNPAFIWLLGYPLASAYA